MNIQICIYILVNRTLSLFDSFRITLCVSYQYFITFSKRDTTTTECLQCGNENTGPKLSPDLSTIIAYCIENERNSKGLTRICYTNSSLLYE